MCKQPPQQVVPNANSFENLAKTIAAAQARGETFESVMASLMQSQPHGDDASKAASKTDGAAPTGDAKTGDGANVAAAKDDVKTAGVDKPAATVKTVDAPDASAETAKPTAGKAVTAMMELAAKAEAAKSSKANEKEESAECILNSDKMVAKREIENNKILSGLKYELLFVP